jgi:thiol:disulfide interchange protein
MGMLGGKMKVAGYLAVFVGGLVACYLFFSLGAFDKLGGVPSHQKDPVQGVSIYLSFIGVMLTAVAVVLAALAIGIGVIAAYTFKELKAESTSISERTSKEVSERVSREVVSEALSEVKVKAMVLDLYAKAEKERQQEEEWGQDPTENEER